MFMGRETAPIDEDTLRKAIAPAIAEFKHHLTAPQFKRMDRVTKAKAVRLFSSSLPGGRPGQKTSQPVLVAIRMRALGKPWKEIYPIAIPNWSKLPRRDEQRFQADKLRKAWRAHKKRHQKRLRKAKSNRRAPRIKPSIV